MAVRGLVIVRRVSHIAIVFLGLAVTRWATSSVQRMGGHMGLRGITSISDAMIAMMLPKYAWVANNGVDSRGKKDDQVLFASEVCS